MPKSLPFQFQIAFIFLCFFHISEVSSANNESETILNLSEEFELAPNFNNNAGSLQLENSTESLLSQIRAYAILENGKIVAEYFNEGINETTLHDVWSITKSWAGLLIGVLEDQGKVSMDETLEDIWPDPSNDIWPFVRDATLKKNVTIESLLTMTSGFDDDPEINFTKALIEKTVGGANLTDTLSYPVWQGPDVDPEFNYMNANILSYVILERSGLTPQDFATEYVMPHLGIEEGTYEWFENIDGVAYSSFGLRMTTEQLAKFGQLYLQDGFVSKSHRLLENDWMMRSTEGHIVVPASNLLRTYMAIQPDANVTYGYRFWVFDDMQAYCAFGAGGQFVCVWPNLSRVLSVQIDSPSNSVAGWVFGWEFVKLVDSLTFSEDDDTGERRNANAESDYFGINAGRESFEESFLVKSSLFLVFSFLQVMALF